MSDKPFIKKSSFTKLNIYMTLLLVFGGISLFHYRGHAAITSPSSSIPSMTATPVIVSDLLSDKDMTPSQKKDLMGDEVISPGTVIHMSQFAADPTSDLDSVPSITVGQTECHDNECRTVVHVWASKNANPISYWHTMQACKVTQKTSMKIGGGHDPEFICK